MNDRDMYYNGYSYGGYTPLNNMQGAIPYNNQMMEQGYMNLPNQGIGGNYTNSQFNDMNERINRLERQVKRLDQRLTRIETPYANTNNYNTEPDSNMYMM